MTTKYYEYKVQSLGELEAIAQWLKGKGWTATCCSLRDWFEEYPWVVFEIRDTPHVSGNSICMGYTPITLAEIFTGRMDKPTAIEVKLNDTHTAEVYAEKVVVGCQTFLWASIEALVEAHTKLVGGKK